MKTLNQNKTISEILSKVLMAYLEDGLEGEGVAGQLNMLKSSIAQEIVYKIANEIAANNPINKV
jgi:hypothetical protein